MIKYSVSAYLNPMLPEAAPKYRATNQVEGVVDIYQLANHMKEHGTIYTKGVIVGVLLECLDCVKENLLNGYKVELGPMGSFHLSLTSKGTETAADFTSQHITDINVRFTPGDDFDNLRDKATFVKTSTRLAQAAVLKAETEGNKPIDLQAIKDEEKRKREEREKENGSGSGSSTGSGTTPGGNGTGGGVQVE